MLIRIDHQTREILNLKNKDQEDYINIIKIDNGQEYKVVRKVYKKEYCWFVRIDRQTKEMFNLKIGDYIYMENASENCSSDLPVISEIQEKNSVTQEQKQEELQKIINELDKEDTQEVKQDTNL